MAIIVLVLGLRPWTRTIISIISHNILGPGNNYYLSYTAHIFTVVFPITRGVRYSVDISQLLSNALLRVRSSG